MFIIDVADIFYVVYIVDVDVFDVDIVVDFVCLCIK